MAKNTKKKTVKSAPHGKGYNSLLIILVSLILIGIPLYIIGRVIYDSYMEAGVPIVGERFEDEIVEVITEEKMEQTKTALERLPYVETATVNLQSATLKIQVDMKDDFTVEDLATYQNEVYNTIVGVLPAVPYFSNVNDMRNYDLEVSIFNHPESLDVYAILLKNSMMEEPKLNIVSSPMDPETTKEVLGQTEEELTDPTLDPDTPVEPDPAP